MKRLPVLKVIPSDTSGGFIRLRAFSPEACRPSTQPDAVFSNMLKFFSGKPDDTQQHSKLAAILFLALLLIVSAVSVAAYFRLLRNEEQRAIASLNNVADLQAGAISAWLNERLRDAATLSSGGFFGENVNRWLREGGMEDDLKSRMRGQLRAIRTIYGYQNTAILDTRGNTLISSDDRIVVLDKEAVDTITRAAASGTIEVSVIHSDRGRGGGSPRPVIEIAVPLLDATGRMSAASSLLFLRAEASFYPISRISTTLLGSEIGAMVAEIRDNQVVVSSANALAAGFGYPNPLPLPPVALTSAAAAGTELRVDTPLRGEAVIAARRVDNAPWFLVALVDEDSIRADARQLAWIVAAASGTALAMIGGMLLLWWKKRQSEYRLASLRAENERQLLQRQYDFLSKYANDMIVVTDRDGRIIEINDRTSQVLGKSRSELVGADLDAVFPDTFAQYSGTVREQLCKHGRALFEFVWPVPKGKAMPVEVSARLIELEGRLYTQFIGRDITERRESETALRESQETLNSILESVPDVVWSFSADLSRLRYINRAAESIYGYPASDFLENPRLWFDIVHIDDRARIEDHLRQLSPVNPFYNDEYRIVRKDGTERWMHFHGRLVLGAYQAPLRIDGIATDVTARKMAELQVQVLAYYDKVTGLPNRSLFDDRLAQALHIAQRSDRKLAVMFMDLDNFKNINDTLGHHMGDMLLQAVSQSIVHSVREEDTVARIGGDEFVVILPDLERGEQAAAVAEKILHAAARPHMLQQQQVHTSVSIGISIYPDDGHEARELVQHADTALYQAKNHGRNNYHFFTREMNQQITRSASIERQLRAAIDAGKLALWYQPQVDTASGELIGAEALLRWPRPDGGFMSPAEFVPVAEDRGLIISIGEWALREACRQCRAWQDDGLPAVPVAVNVSPLQFQRKGFSELVTSILDETGLDARYLELEITESSIMRRAPLVAKLAMELRDAGVGISIDDFGTGYSSLSYLKQIPIDKIKIDRSFIADMLDDADDEAITAAIINLAKNLKLRVLAEGVESQEQLQLLRAMGCNEVQGYYYSSAVEADRFRRFLEDSRMLAAQA